MITRHIVELFLVVFVALLQSIHTLQLENSLASSQYGDLSAALEQFGYTFSHMQSEAHTVNTVPTCQTFNATDSRSYLVYTCSNAVDYPFYIPAGESFYSLDYKAKIILSNPNIALLPYRCQVALKKLVCANTYLKCIPHVQLDDISTYSNAIYSEIGENYPLPFQRPCASLCSNVNSTCYGILNIMGFAHNCAAHYDYSGDVIAHKPYRYDLFNDNHTCNAMPLRFKIGTSIEFYIGSRTGACSGIISELYIPPSSFISIHMAPLQPPFVLQYFFEFYLSYKFHNLPVWMTEDCNFALKKSFCRSFMSKTSIQKFSDALVNFTAEQYESYFESIGFDSHAVTTLNVFLPSYPHHKVCVEYHRACSSFLKLYHYDHDYYINCSDVLKRGSTVVQKFPCDKQKISAFDAVVAPNQTVMVSYTSQPDEINYARNTFRSKCPDVFVIPDDPTDSRVRWIDGTGCAQPCRSPQYTKEEYEFANFVNMILEFMGVPGCLLVYYIWSKDKRQKQNYLVLCFVGFSLMTAISSLILLESPREKATCSNNAVPIDSTDGINACNITSVTWIYGMLGVVLSWMFQSFDLFMKIIYTHNTDKYQIWYFWTILLLPLISVSKVIFFHEYGYSGSITGCSFSLANVYHNSNNYDFLYPAYAVLFFGLLFMLPVLVRILDVKLQSRSNVLSSRISSFMYSNRSYRRYDHIDLFTQPSKLHTNPPPQSFDVSSVPKSNSNNNNNITTVNNYTLANSNSPPNNTNSSSTRKYLLWTPIIYFIVFMSILLASVIYSGITMDHSSKFVESTQMWTDCIFKNYDGESDSWKEICGIHPHLRPNYYSACFFTWSSHSEPLLLSIVFLCNRTTMKILTTKFYSAYKFTRNILRCSQSNYKNPQIVVVNNNVHMDPLSDMKVDYNVRMKPLIIPPANECYDDLDMYNLDDYKDNMNLYHHEQYIYKDIHEKLENKLNNELNQNIPISIIKKPTSPKRRHMEVSYNI